MIVLHSNNCPRCLVIESKLQAKGVEYIKNEDIKNIVEMGFTSAPVLQVDDKYMTFSEANDYINGVEVTECN